ncbi:phage tail tape measure protein [Lactobacillus salivarius]|uniref:phage tail tape measure protein n=1 Tax=Ligilactobacillus salivarius TaxID=1624 RepID=UPI001473401E|nr:phage tail tape measure protein [Ligilactobacillus salivarius]NME24195.1 phage tail tape measure protein [Ligilactobacillus salivarius]
MAVGRPIGSMVVSLGLEAAKFTDGLKSIQNQFRLAKSEMRANIAELSSTGTAYEKASAKVDSLTKVMDVNQRKIESLRETYQQQVKTQGEYSNAAMRTASKINDAIRVQENYRRQLNDAKVAMNEAKRGTDSLRTSLETLQKTTTASITGLQAQGKTNEANLVKYRSLKEEIQQYNRILDDEKAKLKELVNAKGADARETQEQKVRVAELNAKIQQSQASYDSMNSKYKNMSTAQAQAKDSVNKLASSYKSVGDSVKDAGQKLTGFSTIAGLGLAAGLKTSISSLSEFKNTLNEIKNLAVTGGESVEEATRNVSRIQKDATQYSNQYGVSVNKIGDGYKELIKRGYTTNQALGAMKSELQASVASGDDFNDVVNVSSQVLEAFGMKVNSTSGMLKNTKTVTNELAYAADLTSTGFTDIGIGMSYVGSTAKTAKIELSETASAMGILSNNGLEADKAGTGLRQVINNLVTGVKDIDSKNSVLGKLGLKKKDLVDAQGNLKSLSAIFEAINSKMKGKESPEKASIFKSLFGTTGQQAGIILANNVKELDELNKKVREAPKKNYVGALSEKNMKSAQNQIKIFKQSATNMGMSLAEVLLPPLSKVAASLSKFFQWVAQLPKPIKSTIVGVTLLAVAIGPLLVALGSMITAIGSIKKVMTGLSIVKKVKDIANSFKLLTILNPTTLGIGAVIALGAAFVLAYKKIKPFKEFINGIGRGIIKSLRPVITMVGTIGNSLKKLFNAMKSYFSENGLSFLQAFANIFKVVAVSIGVSMSGIIVTIRVALNLIKNIFSTTWGSIEQIVGGVFTAIGGLLKVFAGLFTGNWQLLWSGVKDIFSGIWNSFKGIVGGVINVIIGIVNSGIDGINWLLDKFGAKQVKKLSPVKWATGTTRYYPNGLPETQLAMVNDGGKREAIVYPNGQVGMFKGMNVTTILPKGSHVINGDDTERLGLANYPDMHYYAKGTISFGSIWNGIKSGASKLWDDVSDGVKLAKNIVSHPIEALESAFSGSLKIGKSVQFAIDTAKGLGSFIIKNIKNGIVKEIKKWIDSNEDEGDSNSTSPKPTGSHKHWMEQAGIPKSWYEDLNWIINHESGWRVNATNPGSGAYGIPQSLPGNKMASAGKDWQTNPITQLKWMYSYVKGRYGNASNAKHFWKTHNWYANGGFVTQEQIAHIAEGNRPEAIIPLTNRTRAMQILAQVRDKYGLSAGNVVLSGGKQDNTDLSSLERKFDTVISLLGQIAGLSAEQVNALKAMKPSQNFDKNKFYQDMFRDQTISNYMNM